jgi:hypothetical protein
VDDEIDLRGLDVIDPGRRTTGGGRLSHMRARLPEMEPAGTSIPGSELKMEGMRGENEQCPILNDQ